MEVGVVEKLWDLALVEVVADERVVLHLYLRILVERWLLVGVGVEWKHPTKYTVQFSKNDSTIGEYVVAGQLFRGAG